ncbi:hypothetical protein [Streptomyces sp. NPDC002463]|uniref:hypothetical protein n=1 Tax=Streptomyces sp. NPDC002463 TaxID=3364645 RepID=UPI0036A7AC47
MATSRQRVERPGGRAHLLRRETDSDTWHACAVIGATGTRSRPFGPSITGRTDVQGRRLHTIEYDHAASTRCRSS